MINPVMIIAASAVVLSAFVISLLNKPKLPIVTGALIIVLIFYVSVTFMLDNAIVSFASSEKISDFIQFVVINHSPTYIELEDSFKVLMVMDTSVFLMSIAALFAETLIILKKDSEK